MLPAGPVSKLLARHPVTVKVGMESNINFVLFLLSFTSQSLSEIMLVCMHCADEGILL